MKTLEEIKQMMAAGETVQADGALKELLAAEPDNLQAKMLYGTCRQLLGDEETFRRIHDGLASVMEKLAKSEPKLETVSLWQKYHALWMSLIVGGLVLAGIGYTVYIFGKDSLKMFAVCAPALVGAVECQDTRQLQQSQKPRKFSPVKADKKFIEAEKECTNTSSGEFDSGTK